MSDSWDDLEAPQPLPNIRFKYQGIGASYKKGENEGDDETVNFVFKPIAPIDEIDTAELPDDWQGLKVFHRFRIPSWNTRFEAKQFVKMLGIEVSGATFEEGVNNAVEAFKRQKPVIEATNKRRTWTDKATGTQKFEVNLTKIALANTGGEDE